MTLNRTDAQRLIDSYCDDPPRPDEDTARERLMASDITPEDLALLGEPGKADIQDRVDAAIYGANNSNHVDTLIKSGVKP